MTRLNGGHVLALTALVLPSLVVFSSKGAAPLIIFAALAVLAVTVASGRALPRPPLWLGAGLGAFLAWGLLSSFWAIVPLETVQKTGQLAGIFAAGLILFGTGNSLSEAGRGQVRRGLLAGAALCATVVLIRAASSPDFPILLRGLHTRNAGTHYEAVAHFLYLKATSEVASLLLWPTIVAAAGVGGRRALWGTLAAFLAFLVFTQSYTALLAVIGGGAVFLLARWFFRVIATTIVLGIVLGLVATPTLVSLIPKPPSSQERPWNVPLSLVHRLHIWQFTARRIAEKPIVGWGLNASRSIPGGKQEVKMYSISRERGIFVHATGEIMPLHPHNTPLQLRLETGLPGVGLAVLLLLAGARRLPKVLAAPEERAAALAALVTATIISLSGFGAFQSWWIGVLWLTATFLGAASSAERERDYSRPRSL